MKMTLFLILLIMAVLRIGAMVVGTTGLLGFIIVLGDMIVRIVFMVIIMKWLVKRKKHKRERS